MIASYLKGSQLFCRGVWFFYNKGENQEKRPDAGVCITKKCECAYLNLQGA